MALVASGIIRPPRLVGSSLKTIDDQIMTFDAMITENPSFTAELTSHPVEDGADVTDHFRRNPDKLTMVVFITNTPILPEQQGIPDRDIQIFEDLLRDIWAVGEPLTVITGLRTYENMVLLEVSTTRDPSTGQALSINLNFQEIVFANQARVPVPPEQVGEERRRTANTKRDAGRQDGKEAGGAADAKEGGASPQANKAEEQGGSTLHDLLS